MFLSSLKHPYLSGKENFMKKNHKWVILITIIIIAIVLSFLVANRYLYGSFNVFSQPIRLVYSGYHYNHRSIKAVIVKEKTMIEVSRLFDKITGKRIYSMNKDFIGPGKTIYLHLNGDNYISYTSGGGG